MSKHVDPICGMSIDPGKGINITWKERKYYFCSEHCRNKFVKDNKIELDSSECIECEPGKKKKNAIFQNKLFYVLLVFIAVIIAGLYFPLVTPFLNALRMYTRRIIWAIVLGFVIGGVIDWLIPREYISKILARKSKRTIGYAVIAGFLMSTCSHGILAIAIQLYKKGASAPAVVAFLLASPWANIPITILMFSFFGIKALLIIFSAILIALITGFIFLGLDKRNLVEHNPNTISVEADFSIRNDIKKRINKAKLSFSTVFASIKAIFSGSISLANMVLWWILLGVLLASLSAAYIPPTFMRAYMGASIIGLFVTLLVATVLEICSEGTAPLAFEIYRQTGAIGNSFVFLMAGVVTDYTEIGLLWTNIGKKTAIWLPIVAVPQVILLGYIYNLLF